MYSNSTDFIYWKIECLTVKKKKKSVEKKKNKRMAKFNLIQ